MIGNIANEDFSLQWQDVLDSMKHAMDEVHQSITSDVLNTMTIGEDVFASIEGLTYQVDDSFVNNNEQLDVIEHNLHATVMQAREKT